MESGRWRPFSAHAATPLRPWDVLAGPGAGSWHPGLPPWPYLLGHRGLHHTSRIGLQAVVVAAICAQVQIGPPGGEKGIQSAAGTLQSQPHSQTHRCSQPRVWLSVRYATDGIQALVCQATAPAPFLFLSLFQTLSHYVAQADLGLQSSCLSFPGAEITDA